MRVKLGNRIRICTLATHPYKSDLLILTMTNGDIYTVKMDSVVDAKEAHWQLLTQGWYDFEDCEYSN